MSYLLYHEDNLAAELHFDQNYNITQFLIANEDYLPPYIAAEQNISNKSFDNWIIQKKISSFRKNIEELTRFRQKEKSPEK